MPRGTSVCADARLLIQLEMDDVPMTPKGAHSLAFSRLCRRIADDLLHHFADSRYFAKLCKEIKPQSQQQEPQPYAASVAASLTSTVPALKLLDLRFVLMEDLGFLERVYRQLYMQVVNWF